MPAPPRVQSGQRGVHLLYGAARGPVAQRPLGLVVPDPERSNSSRLGLRLRDRAKVVIGADAEVLVFCALCRTRHGDRAAPPPPPPMHCRSVFSTAEMNWLLWRGAFLHWHHSVSMYLPLINMACCRFDSMRDKSRSLVSPSCWYAAAVQFCAPSMRGAAWRVWVLVDECTSTRTADENTRANYDILADEYPTVVLVCRPSPAIRGLGPAPNLLALRTIDVRIIGASGHHPGPVNAVQRIIGNPQYPSNIRGCVPYRTDEVGTKQDEVLDTRRTHGCLILILKLS